jgi:hypothetical protein
MTAGRQFGSTITSAPECADVQEGHAVRERGQRVARRQARRGGALVVEAVAAAAVLVELDQRERGRVVGADMGVQPHAVGRQRAGQPRAEAVGRDPPEVRDRALQPPERARGVVRAAAGVRGEHVVARGNEIDQRLSRDDDQTRGGHAGTVLPGGPRRGPPRRYCSAA